MARISPKRRRGLSRLTSLVGLRQAWEDLKGTYWFVPAVMAVAAIALAVATIAFDRHAGAGWLEGLRLIGSNGPDGARAVLTTVAASMIGVAGVTFSITIAAVAYGASQFAPRLLTNFMRDRGNQVTLGTYIAAFLYCLVVLRAVNDTWGPSEAGQAAEPFVPQLASLVALALALAGCVVLIYYIHHIPRSIHISHVIAKIGKTLKASIRDRFPEVTAPLAIVPPLEAGFEVRADADGYIQRTDAGHLVECGVAGDTRIDVAHCTGDLIAEGRVLARVGPTDVDQEDLTKAIRSAFAIGTLRTPEDDLLFLANELVEIAGRAMSPGVNDPFTAMSCIDRLGVALTEFAHRGDHSGQHFDDEGVLRVVEPPLTFEGFMGSILDRMRPYLVSDRNTALRLATMLREVAPDVSSEPRRAALRHEIRLLERESAPRLTREDAARLRQLTAEALTALEAEPLEVAHPLAVRRASVPSAG